MVNPNGDEPWFNPNDDELWLKRYDDEPWFNPNDDELWLKRYDDELWLKRYDDEPWLKRYDDEPWFKRYVDELWFRRYDDELWFKRYGDELASKLYKLRVGSISLFSKSLPLLYAWCCYEHAKLMKDNNDVKRDFETSGRFNDVETTVTNAREEFAGVILRLKSKIAQALDTPSSEQIRDVQKIFFSLNPKFRSLRLFVTNYQKTPRDVSSMFNAHDDLRNKIMKLALGFVKSAALSVVKCNLDTATRDDLLANASLIALQALDRFQIGQNATIKTYLTACVRKGSISFLNKLYSKRTSSLDATDESGNSLAERLVDKSANKISDLEIIEEMKMLLKRKTSICSALTVPNVKLCLRYLSGFNIEFDFETTIAILVGITGAKTTYKQLAKDKGDEDGRKVSLQRIQQLCHKGREILNKAFEGIDLDLIRLYYISHKE